MKNTYEKRKKSFIVKWLMAQDNMSTETAAMALDTSLSYLNNKLNRNSFFF